MEKGSKYGQMVLSMKDTGKMIKQMEEGDLFMQMEMPMKDIGKMIKLMDKVINFNINLIYIKFLLNYYRSLYSYGWS